MQKNKIRLIISLAASAVLCFILYQAFDKLVLTQVFGLARVSLKNLAMRAIEESGDKAIAEIGNTTDFIIIERDKNGRVSMISSNTDLLNVVASLTLKYTQESISRTMNSIKIPLGSVLGSTIFSEKGPEIEVKIYMQGFAQTDFITKIENAGINQTWYRLYINISAELRMNVGMRTEFETIENQYLLNESLILGEVPQSYFGGIMQESS